METNLVSTNKTNVLAACSNKPALEMSPTENSLRQWFARFCEVAEREFHKPFVDLWCGGLNDLTPAEVEFGCRAYLRVMKFFPKPGDIRELIDREKEKRLSEHIFAEMEREAASSPEPAPKITVTYESARAAGEKYRQRLSTLVFVPRGTSGSAVKVGPEPIVATNERLALLAKQAREIKARFGGQQ
jgi:hypothetical protein